LTAANNLPVDTPPFPLNTTFKYNSKLNPETPLQEIVRHLDYIADRIGIDCVALGSDFDGATMPADLGDAARLPSLIAALQDNGYDNEAMRKITHANWLRVLRQTWK